MSEKYYFWTQDHTRLEKVIGAHGVDYLAYKLCQTTIEMMNMLQNIMTIKLFNQYKMLIILEELKKKLFLVKDKKEAWYKVERLDQINIFLETDPDGTA